MAIRLVVLDEKSFSGCEKKQKTNGSIGVVFLKRKKQTFGQFVVSS